MENTMAITNLTMIMEKTLRSTMEQFGTMATSLAASVQQMQAVHSTQVQGSDRKRRRSPDPSSSFKRKPPTAGMKLIFGTGSKKSELVGVDRPPNQKLTTTGQLARVEPFKSIYVSRCNCATSADDIVKHMVSNGLIENATEVSVRKLVAANADISRLSFISFKIGVNDETVFSRLMDANSWPATIAVREFVQQEGGSPESGFFHQPAKKPATGRSLEQETIPNTEPQADMDTDQERINSTNL